MPAETDLAAALSRRPVAAIVSNPTALRLEVAGPAAEAGCHLFLEKPVSHTPDGLVELERVAKENGLKVLVGFQFRFHPGLKDVKRLLDASAIGRVVSAHVRWGEYLPNWHPGEDFRRGYSARSDLGGGVLLTLCHPFDYLTWLLGPVQTVMCIVGSRGFDLGVEDTAHALLTFDSGVTGTVHLDYVQRPPCHDLKVVGSDGTLTWDNSDGAVRIWREDSTTWDVIPVPAGFERNTMFLDEMRHFLACMEGMEEPEVTLADGSRALGIALALKESARTNQAVRISEV